MLKFILGLFLCVLIWVAPIAFLLLGFLTLSKVWFILAFASFLVMLMTKNLCYTLLHNGRQEKDYDEFGRSKRKQIKNLSRAEQDAIDLQNVADMERLLSTPVIKKITKKGSNNPQKDLEAMIGLGEVKQKVSEMSARMQFEKQCNKGKKKSANSMSGRHFVFYGSAGTGKAQPLYSKVLTPNGFVAMGDIKVGDRVISGTNNVSTVLGVYPQGKKDVFEITFDDGSTCRCSDEHLWTVQTDTDRMKGTYRTVPLSEIRDNLIVYHGNTPRKNYSIDYVKPISFEEKEFYIHPYLLGLMIRDESLSNKELSKKIKEFFPNEKFIPKEYLYSSEEQRWWLLKGLLDTDGYAEKTGIEYTTTSRQLKDDLIELVHSLGGYASSQEKQGNYRICIQFTNERTSSTCKRYIASVEYIGKEECQCIYIDDPSHLYITDNYIITHNTTVARIVTGFLYQYGYIKKNKVVEVDGNFLKAGADTAKKVQYVTQIAYGGVLFIDEAYVLCEGAYGNEAVATLIKEMEDNRDRFVCILAGYTKDMNALLDSNTGFKSRIKEYLNFPDYSIEDMKEIFTMMAHQQNFTVSKEALDNLEVRLDKEKKLKTFGNGRTVRNVLDESIDRHSLNYVQKKIPENMKFCICKEDVSTSIRLNGIT